VRRVPAVVWILLLTAAIRLVYGAGYVGYDAYWSVVWGGDLAHAQAPDLERLLAPTPHPLAVAAGVILAPLGRSADEVFALAVTASFAALAWASLLAGRRLFGTAVGVAFALIVVTRPDLVAETLYASIDVPFAALVVGALAVEAREGDRRPALVLVLLGLAGLLRPEGWLLAGAYAVWAIARERPSRRRALALIGGAAAAPLAWMAFDLAFTGDPLHSLHGTQALAEQLARPRSLGTALEAAPDYLRGLLDSPALLWGGIAGALVGLWALYERALLPLAVLVLTLLGFVVLGVSELPLLVRYLLLPAVMLCLFAAVAALGWTSGHGPPAGAPRRAWQAGGAVLLVWLAIGALDLPDRVDGVQQVTVVRRDLQSELEELADRPRARVLQARCGTAYVPNHQLIPPLAHEWGRDVYTIVSAQLELPRRGLLISPTTPSAQRGFAFDAREPRRYPFAVPADFRLVEANASWALYERC